MKPILEIAGYQFHTQKELSKYLNTIREESESEFEVRANSAKAKAILDAIMTTRLSKAAELRGRSIEGWTRKKRGLNWALHARLSDGTLLHMGIRQSKISEFWHACQARSAAS